MKNTFQRNLNAFTTHKTQSFLTIGVLLIIFQLFMAPAMAQINWPAGQLLPSFPAPAQTQDLIFLNGSVSNEKSWRWEAEGPRIGHGTGRLEGDGWLCQSGIDEPNKHMIYGPYDNTVSAGTNTAEFRMKIDNNTANNDVVVDIDVVNYTTGAMLAFKSVTRQDFSVAGNYVSFNLPFTLAADNQALELRVHWKGGSYIKVDYVGVKQNNSAAEMYLFSSLKGIVNKTKPRIFSYEGDAFAEGPYTWLQSLGLGWTEHADRWTLIEKYRSEISGLIVYDPAQNHTVNLATMLAKSKNAIIASPALVQRLTSAPYNLPVLEDLRGKFTSKLQIYQHIYNVYWPSMDHRLLIGLSPDAHQASLREYAAALGAATIWLDPAIAGESELLNSFLSSMPAGANFMGWWPEEGAGITRASQYGISTIASDYACNLTMHSGMPRTINVKPIPPKPLLQNKIYVAFILSDGDNLQYVEHLMRKLWNNPDRGSVPIGWTVSPAMLDAMPGALNFYHQSATANDNLISGPSGYGYTYPNSFPNQNSLNQFVAKTEEYNRKAGLRVVTIWNTIVGGINQNVGESFANNAPSLLGVTGQNTGGPLSIYNNSLPGKPLSCNYCTNEQAMKDHIASAAAGWNRAEPRFIIIQAQPWTDVKPSNFKNVANSLNADYVVVRPDHLFQLLRESKGLPINPGNVQNSTTGLVTAYKDCNYTGFSAGLDVGDYNLGQLQALGVVDNDISSLKITQGYKAVLFDGDNFTGASTEITADMGCSADWNDRVTSIRIQTNGDPNINGVFYLQNKNSNLNLDVLGLSTADGASVLQGSFNGGANQQFKFEHLERGTYKVSPVHSGKVLDVDGIKKENGVKVQQWTYFGSANQQFIAVPTGDGYYKLVAKHSGRIVEVANASTANGAVVQQWDNNNQTCGQWKLVPITAVNGNGDGLTGNYFQGMNFEIPKLARKDATVNFNWADGAPGTGIAAESFSARWTGQVQPRYSGEYTFYINSDNGRRLWVNGQLLIDKWLDDVAENTGKINLTAGTKYDIKIEYFENVGGANIKLEWSSALQAREVVPTTQLYSNPLPSVSITSPANNASFLAPAAIAINAAATDNGSVSKVDFYNGATLLGSDNSSPYSFAWNNLAVGNYTITTIATDNSGAFAISAPVAVSVKTDQLTGNGDGLSGNYFNGMNFETAVFSRKDATLNINWGDGSPNAAVNADRFSARWTGQIQPKYSGEYTFYINSDNGRRVWINNVLIIDQWADNWGTDYTGKITLTAQQKYDIKVEYFENVGGANIKLEWSSANQVREIIPTSQLYANPLPQVSLSVSATTAVAPANITLTANATDADGIAKVDFYNGSTLLFSDNAAPYSYSWNNVAIGSYSITALATDSKSGVTLSSVVTVTINSAVNQAPTVSLTSPANNASYNVPASIGISANASDADGTISKVEFYNGSQKLGEDASSPYAYTWTNVAAGNYTLLVKAYDNAGAVSTSGSVAIKVVTVVSDQCAAIAAYAENAGYAAGSKVKHGGKRYECKEFPYSGWCNGAAWAYAPGTGAYWADAWYDRGSCTAREEQSENTTESSVLIVPNPATDLVTIHSNHTSVITIYNSQGLEVMSQVKVEADGQLQLNHLSSGIYLIKIDIDAKVITQTLIKN